MTTHIGSSHRGGSSAHNAAFDVSSECVESGILSDLKIVAGSGLDVTITEGRAISPFGMIAFRDATFDSTLTNTAINYLFWNVAGVSRTSFETIQGIGSLPVAELAYVNTTGTKRHFSDVLLAKVTCAGGSVTKVELGELARAKTIPMAFGVDLAVTGPKGIYEHYGKPIKAWGIQVDPLTNFVGTDGVVTLKKVTRAGTASSITTLTITAVTKDLLDPAISFRKFDTPVVLQSGDRIVADVTTALGTSGTGHISGILGGAVQE